MLTIKNYLHIKNYAVKYLQALIYVYTSLLNENKTKQNQVIEPIIIH